MLPVCLSLALGWLAAYRAAADFFDRRPAARPASLR